VVDIADPYDGYNRCLPASPFLPAVLAECGVPAVSHGLDAVGPKFGVTHRHVLQAAGIAGRPAPADAAARLSDPDIGWTYIDQRAFVPKLHNLVPFRGAIVKRQVLTTVEVLARPIHGRNKTHLVTGYVHKPYPRIYALLARHAGFDSALLVRGVEGGVVPSLRQEGVCFNYQQMGEEQAFDIDPPTSASSKRARGAAAGRPAHHQPPRRRHRRRGRRAGHRQGRGTGRHGGLGGPARSRPTTAWSSRARWCSGTWAARTDLQAGADRIRAALDSGAAAQRLR
jgi:anthranilate phosphoribosyltransferase